MATRMGKQQAEIKALQSQVESLTDQVGMLTEQSAKHQTKIDRCETKAFFAGERLCRCSVACHAMPGDCLAVMLAVVAPTSTRVAIAAVIFASILVTSAKNPGRRRPF